MQQTDIHHITVAGVNPHDVARAWGEEGSPFSGEEICPSVHQHIVVDGQLVGGTVAVWTPEHLTPTQERYLDSRQHVIDVRHVYP